MSLAIALSTMFRCPHPAGRLTVDREQTVDVIDDDFTHVRYHLICVEAVRS